MLVDVVMDEAVKTMTASVAGAGVKGLGRLWQVVRTKTDSPPERLLADPEEAVEFLTECGRDDPRWLADVAGELAQRIPAPTAEGCSPPAPFWDRDAMRSAVPATGVRVFAGPHGVGKTALVCQLAAEQAARFPVNRCYLDLDLLRDGDVPRLAEAKRHVLRQLGVAEIAAAEPELSRQYLSASVHRRLVLVLDNVLGAEEVAALAPGSPAALTLVTTRRLTNDLRARYPGWVVLDGLDEPGAWAMLASRCGEALLAAEPAATAELLRRFGRLPYAIEQLGGVLALRSREPGAVAALLAEFAEDGFADTNRLIDDLVAGTVALLPAATVDDFLVLAAHPAGEFTVAGAEAMLGRRSRTAVDALREVGLLTAAELGRYRLPWFARRYAGELGRQRALDTEPATARALSYYANRAVAADLAGGPRLRRYPVPETPPWPESGLNRIDWLDAEREVLAESVRQAHERQRHDLVVQLCGGLEVLSLHRGRPELCLQAFELGVLAARELGNPALVARMHGLCGRIYTLLHLVDRAGAALDAAWRVASALDDPELAASTWEFSGRLAEEQADYGAAVAAFGRAVDIDARTGHGRAFGIHARMLANVLVTTGRAAEALPLLEQAAAHTTDDRNGSRVCTVRAKALVALGDVAAASVEIDRAGRLAGLANAGQYGYELTDVRAEIAFSAGDLATARSCWGWLVAQYLDAGHPKSATYLAKLNQLPPRTP